MSEIFHPGFAALVRSGRSFAELATWEGRIPREPRLVVPIDVQALVVPPGRTEPRADIGGRLLRKPASEGERFTAETERVPPPFTDAEDRAPGVYLHWAMPDGLTAGRTTEGESAALRPLPNRWVVVRLTPGAPRGVEAWVLESERGWRGRLAGWREEPARSDAATPDLPPADLTAVTGGSPAWAAVYDDVENRFAMHDPLDGVDPSVRLTYVVAGWYSVPELDPLHGAGPDELAFDDLLASLGWSLDDPRLDAARKAAQARRQATASIGVETPPAMLAASVVSDASLLAERALGPVGRAARTEEARSFAATHVSAALLAEAVVISAPQPWWPRQSLYHGTVFGVRGDGSGGDPRPDAAGVHVVAAATAAEALAVTVAAGLSDVEAAERLLTAFAAGLISEYEAVDGLAAIDAALHAQAFTAIPGGSDEEPDRIRLGGSLTASETDAEAGASVSAPKAPLTLAVRRTVVEMVTERAELTMQRFVDKARARRPPPPPPARIEEVARPQPRFFIPTDPVLALRGLNRSLRSGYDGRFEPDERLATRVSREPHRRAAGIVDARDLLLPDFAHGGIPDEVVELVREAALTDPYHLDTTIETAVSATDLPREAVATRLAAEVRLLVESSAGRRRVRELSHASVLDGVTQSPVAVTYWAQPWVPLYVEWTLELRAGDRLDGWQLGELDLEPGEGADVGGATPQTVSGRMLLTSSGAKALAEAIHKFLDAEARADTAGTGVVSPETAGRLKGLGDRAGAMDVLGGALAGVREHLLGFDTDTGYGAAPQPPAPTRVPQLLRAGLAKITALRVVDAFGRFVELDPDELRVAGALAPPEEESDGKVLLAPRFTAPSRLLLRFVGAGADQGEARVDQRADAEPPLPVAAWLLPDHVDGALEVFDARGEPLGQLHHEALGGGVVWEGAPGRPGPLGAPPASPGPAGEHIEAFVSGCVRADAERRAGGRETEETPLWALLRCIDTASWTVEPAGASEHLSQLVGRPVAMVRATLRLEVLDDLAQFPSPERAAAYAALADRAVAVRLGALTRLEDGLLGFFVGDDYSRFYPAAAEILEAAVATGPHTGFLGPAPQTGDPGATLAPQPVASAYVADDPVLAVRPRQTVTLTLLMDPAGSVTATAGVVPRKSVALLRDWVADALARLSPSFRFGPVLVDPQTVRMPRISGLPERQIWTHRDTPTSWRDDPIAAATAAALLPDHPAQTQEGWIRVRAEEGEEEAR